MIHIYIYIHTYIYIYIIYIYYTYYTYYICMCICVRDHHSLGWAAAQGHKRAPHGIGFQVTDVKGHSMMKPLVIWHSHGTWINIAGMCVYVYIYVFVYIYIYIYTCICVYIYIFIYIRTYRWLTYSSWWFSIALLNYIPDATQSQQEMHS